MSSSISSSDSEDLDSCEEDDAASASFSELAEDTPNPSSGTVTASFQFDGVFVRVVKGDIAKEQVDVIVNSTSPNLDLKSGKASRSLLQKAGNSLQDECSKNYPNGITVGQVAVTGGGNLPCQHVYHGSLLKWGKDNAEQTHKDFVTKCLEQAHGSDLSSIALPGLTTGFLAFPKDIASRNACKCVEQFIKNNPDTTLTDIRFVVFGGDIPTLKAFEHSVRHWKDTIEKDVPSRTIATYKVGNTSITLKLDRIENQQVDIIVNTTNDKLQLNKGSVSRSLTTVAGSSLQQECKQQHPNGISWGDLVMTGGGNLRCKHVYHACLSEYNVQNHDSSVKALRDIIYNCLQKANNDDFSTIAFPALGTKYLKYPCKVSAKTMISAIQQHCTENSDTSVTDVSIIIYVGDQNTVGKAFEKEFGKTTPGSPVAEATDNGDIERGTKEFCAQKYAEELKTPSYWTQFTSNKTVKQWKMSVTEHTEELVHVVDVDQRTFNEVSDLVRSTWQVDKVGHGRDAAGLGNIRYSKLNVKKVQRVENIDLYEKYASARSQLFHKAGVTGVFEPLEDIGNSKGPVLTANTSSEMLQNDLFHEINEVFLFHGTKADTLGAIEKQGLDFRMSGEKGMFGQGMYLAESSTKADQYTDPRNQRSKDAKTMLLTRVSLGKICLLNTARNTLKRPPCFVQGCCSDSCGHGDHERCDCVVGDGTWLFREFVIYSQYQAYPEYVITYERE